MGVMTNLTMTVEDKMRTISFQGPFEHSPVPRTREPHVLFQPDSIEVRVGTGTRNGEAQAFYTAVLRPADPKDYSVAYWNGTDPVTLPAEMPEAVRQVITNLRTALEDGSTPGQTVLMLRRDYRVKEAERISSSASGTAFIPRDLTVHCFGNLAGTGGDELLVSAYPSEKSRMVHYWYGPFGDGSDAPAWVRGAAEQALADLRPSPVT